MKLLSFSFDDGFLKSTLKTAQIFESHNLRAGFNIVASAHLPGYPGPGPAYPGIPAGDFTLWNQLVTRGHEVMPHGYRHANKTLLPLSEAQALIEQCLQVFENELTGFDRHAAVFNFPYNASTPALNEWLRTQVRAIRCNSHEKTLNPLPSQQSFLLASAGHGRDDCEARMREILDAFLSGNDGWLVYTLHGLDKEGFGPISADFLDSQLSRLTAVTGLTLLPAGQALAKYGTD